MSKIQNLGGLMLVAVALVHNSGCTKQDNDHLARIGQVLGAQAEDAAGDLRLELSDEWQKIQTHGHNHSLLRRVTERLRNEKSLADADIQVVAYDDVVELSGQVRSLQQRQRAVDLVSSTLGVTKVKDSLEVVPLLQTGITNQSSWRTGR